MIQREQGTLNREQCISRRPSVGLKQGHCLYERLRQNEKHLFLQVRL